MKNLNSKTTVVIPCYNDGAYIKQAIKSVCNQSLPPDKIIIVDDGSEQKTRNILKSINNPLVQIVYQENQGVCNARNTAIDMATTDYILTLDADDYFEPTFLEKAFTILNTKDHVAAVCSYYKGFNDRKSLSEVVQPLGGTIQNFLVKNNGVASALFRKTCWKQVGGYDPNFDKGFEDWDFWISILKHDWKMETIPEVLFRYRIKNESRDQTAVALYDAKLRVQLFNKHKSTYLTHFDKVYHQLIYKSDRQKNTILKRERSIEYRIGSKILSTIRYIKQLLKK